MSAEALYGARIDSLERSINFKNSNLAESPLLELSDKVELLTLTVES